MGRPRVLRPQLRRDSLGSARQATVRILTSAFLVSFQLAACSRHAPEVTRPVPLPVEPASTIYRLALDSLLSRGLSLVVLDSTWSFPAAAITDSDLFLTVPAGFEESVTDFRAKIERSIPIPAIAPAHARIIRMSSKEAGSLGDRTGRRLRNRFNCGIWECAEIISLTAIGMSPDSAKAVLYLTTWCGGTCGTNTVVYLTRSGGGPWALHWANTIGAM